MTKWTKLYDQLASGRIKTVSFSDFEHLLGAFGFVRKRRKGSHQSFKHPKVPDVVTIQPRGKDAAEYQVQRLLELISKYDLHMDG